MMLSLFKISKVKETSIVFLVCACHVVGAVEKSFPLVATFLQITTVSHFSPDAIIACRLPLSYFLSQR